MRLMTAFAGVVVMAASAGAEDLVIQSFGGNGNMTWAYATNGVSEYRIEWCSDLAAGLWSDLKGDMQRILPTGAVMSVSVPMFYRVKALGPAPADMAYIPAGSFQMGDGFTEGDSSERPVHTVYVSAFYMDKTEVTWAKWQEVQTWAAANGYDIGSVGAGRAADHPVHTVSWYDCVKWLNARSQKESRSPCYTVGGAVYKAGQYDDIACNWSANGYRLPTEAEWEKAARGGLSGKRFPWGDTITHSQANYNSSTSYAYDTSPTRGFHPSFYVGYPPYTSAAGSFATNGYGLHDMSGNVWEWCWDWFGDYPAGIVNNPRGPSSPSSNWGSSRVFRGGSWNYNADFCRSSYRYDVTPRGCGNNIGFRAVLPPGQQ